MWYEMAGHASRRREARLEQLCAAGGQQLVLYGIHTASFMRVLRILRIPVN